MGLLGLASAAAKVTKAPQELEFFGNAGLSETLVMVFGVIQLVSAILLFVPKTRKIGASVLALTFLFSTVLIFMSGNIQFAVFSLLPVVLLGFIVLEKTKPIE